MGQRSRIQSGDQILVLEAVQWASRSCSSCREPVEKKIVSGIRHNGGTAQCQTLSLCNVCLSRLRELISEHEATPTAVRKVPAICTACGHTRDSHYVMIGRPPAFAGSSSGCVTCGACPGYAGPT